MRVDHAIDSLGVGLETERDPLLQGPIVVTDVEASRRLHAGKDAIHGGAGRLTGSQKLARAEADPLRFHASMKARPGLTKSRKTPASSGLGELELVRSGDPDCVLL